MRNLAAIFCLILGVLSCLAKAEITCDSLLIQKRWEEGTRPVRLNAIPDAVKPPGYLRQNFTLIGGQIVDIEGSLDEIYSPVRVQLEDGTVTAMPLGSVPRMTAEQGLAAYNAARGAWDFGLGEWPSMTMDQRIEHMKAFVAGMKSRRDVLIRWVMWEIGKSTADASGEVDRTLSYIEDTISAAQKLNSESKLMSEEKSEHFERRREPLGVGLFFAPYNYPLNETFTNLIPALIMGNTAVVKPARFGTLLMNPLLDLFKENFPPGVVNFIYGDGREVLKGIQEQGGYEALGFIGGEVTAAAIIRANRSPQRTTPILGLGAKNMAVILDDANLGAAVKSNITGCLSFNGQRCTAHKILFVQAGIAEKFIAAFSNAVDQLSIGQPWSSTDKMTITASPDTGWVQRMDDLKKDAIAKGARVVNHLGGKHGNGFYAPTILVGVKPGMRIYNEEQFGTIVPIVVFKDINEPIEWQKQSAYGQQAALYGNSAAPLNYLARNLSRMVGRINVNTACRRSPDHMPFNGRGDSGQGTLSLVDALYAYSTHAVICEDVGSDGPKVVR